MSSVSTLTQRVNHVKTETLLKLRGKMNLVTKRLCDIGWRGSGTVCFAGIGCRGEALRFGRKRTNLYFTDFDAPKIFSNKLK